MNKSSFERPPAIERCWVKDYYWVECILNKVNDFFCISVQTGILIMKNYYPCDKAIVCFIKLPLSCHKH